MVQPMEILLRIGVDQPPPPPMAANSLIRISSGPWGSGLESPRSVQSLRLSWGKRTTSRMVGAPVSIMMRRSMPMPMPPAGGMPCSRARTKSWSISWASPPALLPRSARRWTSGSLSSE